MRVLISALLGFALLTISAMAAGPTIIAPDDVLQDAQVPVRVVGLTAGDSYTIQGAFITRGGTLWRSTAKFKADPKGVIDLARDAPIEGTWEGADPTAIFWSMVNTKERTSDPSLFESDDANLITLSVLEGDKAIASHLITLRKKAIGISSTDIRDPITGTFYAPYGKRNLGAVLVMGGSEGGVPTDRAALIASHGYATLALAYFSAPGLPPDLEQIPLEYVDRALKWLASQPAVDPRRVAILGVSKSAELALLEATRNHSPAAVVAIAPASVVFQSLSDQRNVNSSWTVGGVDVPFAPFVVTDSYRSSHRMIDLFTATLAAAPAQSEIPVEKITAPVLLLAGHDDQLWPSAEMAQRLADRARRFGTGSRVTLVVFENAGHHVATLPHRPTGDSVRLGGTARGLDRAQIASWKKLFEFLGETLKSK